MTVKDDVKALLSATRGDVELNAELVRVVADYYVDVAMISDVKEVKLQTLSETVVEAWAEEYEGAKLPAMHIRAPPRRPVPLSPPPPAPVQGSPVCLAPVPVRDGVAGLVAAALFGE